MAAETMFDPVCGMVVHPENAIASVEYGGKTYYFCSEECKDEFNEDPEMYIAEEETQPYEEEGGL